MPDAPGGAVHIRNPVLPTHLSKLTITNLRVGASRLSLHFERHASRTLVNVLAGRVERRAGSGSDRVRLTR
jgi:hypothetical protein